MTFRHECPCGEVLTATSAVALLDLMSDHDCTTDAFDAFARRDLEARGVDPDTAARVVRNTYDDDNHER